jgi:hypothetical protein
MQTEQLEPVLELQDVDSDADFVLFCVARGLLSEHCTMREAQMAFFTRGASAGHLSPPRAALDRFAISFRRKESVVSLAPEINDSEKSARIRKNETR